MLLAAGHSLPCTADNQEHLDTIREYAAFLLSVPQAGPIEIKWEQLDRYQPSTFMPACCMKSPYSRTLEMPQRDVAVYMT